MRHGVPRRWPPRRRRDAGASPKARRKVPHRVRYVVRTQFRRNVLAGPVSSGANIVLTVLSYPLYLGYLGYEQFGVWLLLSTVVAFIQLTNLGFGPALQSLVAEAKGRGDTTAVRGLASSAGALLTLIGLVSAAVAWMASDPILGMARLQGEPLRTARELFPWAGVLSVTALLAQNSTATLSGLGRADLASYIESSSRLGALAISAVLLRSGWRVEGLIAGSIVAQLALALVVHRAASRSCGAPLLSLAHVRPQWVAPLLRRASGLALGAVVGLFTHPFNRFVMARWGGVESVPVYDIAYSGAMQLRSLFESGGRALVPEVSEAWGGSGVEALKRIRELYQKVTRLFTFGAGPILFAAGVAAEPALKLWLGNRYQAELVPSFRIMLVGCFGSLVAVPGFYVAIGLGRSRTVGIGQSLLAAVNVAGAVAWGHRSGGMSAGALALVVSGALIVSAIYYLVATRQLLAGIGGREAARAVSTDGAGGLG